jgi:hypothetical protein
MPWSPAPARGVGGVGALVFFGPGAVLLGAEIRRLSRLRRWPSVLGRIIDSQVKRSETDGGVVFNVHVEYEYRRDGDLRQGSEELLPFPTSAKRARAPRRAYRCGLELPIAFGPMGAAESMIAGTAQHELQDEVVLLAIVMLLAGIGMGSSRRVPFKASWANFEWAAYRRNRPAWVGSPPIQAYLLHCQSPACERFRPIGRNRACIG